MHIRSGAAATKLRSGATDRQALQHQAVGRVGADARRLHITRPRSGLIIRQPQERDTSAEAAPDFEVIDTRFGLLSKFPTT